MSIIKAIDYEIKIIVKCDSDNKYSISEIEDIIENKKMLIVNGSKESNSIFSANIIKVNKKEYEITD